MDLYQFIMLLGAIFVYGMRASFVRGQIRTEIKAIKELLKEGQERFLGIETRLTDHGERISNLEGRH